MPRPIDTICERLPVFPLPEAVLMPGAVLPLHVFEPRYRDLVQHCLDGDGVMAIATLQPGFEADYEGRPDFYDLVGVGEVVAHEALPDGRFHILLRYVGRARVERELDVEHAFRVVQAAPCDDDAAGAEGALRDLKVLLLQLGARGADDGDPQRVIVDSGLELVDRVAHQVLRSCDDRRAYLALDRVVDRITMVEERLATLMQRRTTPVGEA